MVACLAGLLVGSLAGSVTGLGWLARKTGLLWRDLVSLSWVGLSYAEMGAQLCCFGLGWAELSWLRCLP